MGFKNIFVKKAAVTTLNENQTAVYPSPDFTPYTGDIERPESPSPAYFSSLKPSVSHVDSLVAVPQKSGDVVVATRVYSPPVSISSTPESSRHPSVGSVRGTTPTVSRENSTSSRAQLSQAHSASCVDLRRIVVLPDGSHEHHLKNTRRQEKLGRMLREIVGTGQKVGNDAVSAIPEFMKQPDASEDKVRLTLMHGLVNKLANGEVEVGRVNGSSHQAKRTSGIGRDEKMDAVYTPEIHEVTARSLAQKYGRCQEVIGRGSYGVVRISHKQENGKEQLYAVKEFRKRGNESLKAYHDRLMSEFCISSSLRHTNIILTIDLMKDTQGGCCQIMEYCSGGDLYSLILSSGTGLSATEADCFFKQILRGVVYMHSMGVAHCDLKPENILLTQNGVCKISDFGNGECFRMAWETDVHYSKGVVGSGPYIAPEEFKGKAFDPRAADIWALGIIYMVSRTGSYLWRKAHADEDDHYAKYLRDRKTSKGFTPVERLSPSKCVYVIYSILDPVPSRRITGKQILNSEWGRSIHVCNQAELKNSSTANLPTLQ